MVFLTTALTGCGLFRRAAIRITDEHIQNIETLKVIAERLAIVSEFSTSFIRTSLGVHINMLPKEAVDVLDAIDELVSTTPVEEMTDAQKGELLGHWTRFVTRNTLEIVSEFAPDVLTVAGIAL